MDREERLLDVQFDVEESRVGGARGDGHARVGRGCRGRDPPEVEDLLAQTDARQVEAYGFQLASLLFVEGVPPMRGRSTKGSVR